MTVHSAARLDILADAEALALRVAEWMSGLAEAKPGTVSICLSGGSTPKKLYEQLATSHFRDQFPWSRTHWFWGDERFVPHDDARSNFRMAQEALLSQAPIPAANIHPVPIENLEPEAAALAYQRELKRFHGSERLDSARPLFDVTLLGLGTDGHTASLFPGAPALAERQRWVAVVDAKPEPRITLTYPALESSAHVAFLASGENKRAILRRFLCGDSALPAARMHPVGELLLFCDVAAGSGSG